MTPPLTDAEIEAILGKLHEGPKNADATWSWEHRSGNRVTASMRSMLEEIKASRVRIRRLEFQLSRIANLECSRRERVKSEGRPCGDFAPWPCGSCQARAALAEPKEAQA